MLGFDTKMSDLTMQKKLFLLLAGGEIQIKFKKEKVKIFFGRYHCVTSAHNNGGYGCARKDAKNCLKRMV